MLPLIVRVAGGACLLCLFVLASCEDENARPDAGSDTGGVVDGADAADGQDAGPDAGRDGGDVAADVSDGATDGAADEDVRDYPPARPAIIPLDGQVLFPVHLDGREEVHHLVVDTGAFATSVEETLVRDVVNGKGVVSIDFGEGIAFDDLEVFAADLARAEDYIGWPIHGLIGQDIFQQTYFGLDYRAEEVTISLSTPSDPPPGFAAADGIPVPYELVQLLPIVEAQAGDKTARLIADTGSGVTILTASFTDPALLAEGITGYLWHTSYGSDPATIVRLPELVIGGTPVERSWAVIIPDEHHLKPVFDALGVEMDGFLGYPVYRRFYVAVEGGSSRYRFYPYPDLEHIPAGEWDRVGIEVRREADQVVIDMVFSPSDADDQGILAEDVLISVDGTQAASLALDELRLLLRGAPGATRALCFEQKGCLDVAVDRLLEPL